MALDFSSTLVMNGLYLSLCDFTLLTQLTTALTSEELREIVYCGAKCEWSRPGKMVPMSTLGSMFLCKAALQ